MKIIFSIVTKRTKKMVTIYLTVRGKENKKQSKYIHSINIFQE